MKTYDFLRGAVLDITLKTQFKDYVNRKIVFDSESGVISDGLIDRIFEVDHAYVDKTDELKKIAIEAQYLWATETDLPPKITKGFPIDEEFVLRHIFRELSWGQIDYALKTRANLQEVA